MSKHVEHWRDTTQLNNIRVAEQIRDDRIDILVDLAGHTRNNRLFVFARKPAPVQATWIGYPNTTGVKMIDYRITDAITDPFPDADARNTEQLVRLPGCFLCYAPPADSIEPAPPPSQAAGHITFGAFNRIAKVSDFTIDLWAKVLSRVPKSKLIFKGDGLTMTTMPQCRRRLTRGGIDSSRIEFQYHSPSKREHLAHMARVDIALDTYPYNGTTMTCDWLWTGVPVVTLSGQTHASRVGRSLLTTVGLSELAVDTPEQYVDLAVQLAGDAVRLSELRRGLRSRMKNSPLTDGAAFTKNLEIAYRQMWQTWCAKQA